MTRATRVRAPETIQSLVFRLHDGKLGRPGEAQFPVMQPEHQWRRRITTGEGVTRATRARVPEGEARAGFGQRARGSARPPLHPPCTMYGRVGHGVRAGAAVFTAWMGNKYYLLPVMRLGTRLPGTAHETFLHSVRNTGALVGGEAQQFGYARNTNESFAFGARRAPER